MESVSGEPKRPVSRGGRRVLLTTFGSLGDLHPYLAIAIGLRQRGHRPVLASQPIYRDKVEGEGVEFQPLGPEAPPMGEMRDVVRRLMHPGRGSERVIRDLLMPHLREQYRQTVAAAAGADLVVSHPITYATPLAAQKLRVPWVATVLQPMIFASAHDPPVPPGAPWAASIYRLGPRVNRWLLAAAKRSMRHWVAPVDSLRRDLGLPPGGHPIFEGQFSPYLNLGLFSPLFASPQPDWPPRTLATGYAFYDRQAPGCGMPAELQEFLDSGPAPAVFTLGSSAVMVGGDFFVESARAAAMLGLRSVLLVGSREWNRLPDPLPSGAIACDYAPFGELFGRAAVVVHQGGAGTTGQALRAGRPMLVVPFSHDQPDHAMRVRRLGVGRALSPGRYRAGRVARELRALLEEPAYAARAAECGARVRSESGVDAVCDALESCMDAYAR